MGVLVQRVPWTEQPPPNTPANLSHPCAKDLQWLLSGNSTFPNFIRGSAQLKFGSNYSAALGYIQGTPSSTSGAYFDKATSSTHPSALLLDLPEWTFIVRVRSRAATGTNAIFARYLAAGGGAASYEIGVYQGSNVGPYVKLNGATILYNGEVWPSPQIADQAYAYRFISGEMKVWDSWGNSKVLATDSSITYDYTPAKDALICCGYYTGSEANASLIAMFSRGLHETEISDILQSPWQLFEP